MLDIVKYGLTSLAVVLGLTAWCPALRAVGSQSSQQAPPERPVFRAGTYVIEADVIVRDRSGRFVSDLTRDDFELLEEGRPQRIETVFLVTQRNANGTSAGPASGASEPIVRRLTMSRLFVLFFDDEHMLPGNFRRLQQAAERFAQTVLQPGDLAGVVASGQMVGKRLTSDREEVLANVRGLKPSDETRSRRFDYQQWPRIANDVEAERIAAGDETALGVATRRACEDDPPACRTARLSVQSKANQIATQLNASSQRTLAMLRTLAAGLARIDGRKTIVLLSDGFTLGPFTSQVEQIVGQAARTGVTFYGVDARGLARGNRGREATDPAPADLQETSGAASAYDSTEDAQNALAADTGGFVVRNSNDLEKAFAEIADHTSTYYVLGYTPDTAKADGKFHRWAVRVKRQGVSVRARKGYLAADGPTTRFVTDVTPERASTDSSAVSATRGPSTPPADPLGRVRLQADPLGSVRLQADRPAAASDAPVASSLPDASTPDATAEGMGAASPITPNASAGNAAITVRSSAMAHMQTLATKGDRVRVAPTTVRDLDPALAKATEGWERYAVGDVEGAANLLREAAGRPGSPVWVNYALGEAEFARSQPARAIAAWEAVRTSEPDFEPVYFELADAYVQTKDHDTAIRVLRQAGDRWPRDPEVYNAIAVIQISRGTLDAGLDTLEQALAVAPTYALTHFNFAKACELKYVKSLRYVQPIRQYVRDEGARKKAIAHYTRYLELDEGGAFANSAREGLQRLQWNP